MKLEKYLKVLTMGKDALNVKMAKARNKSASKKCDLEIAKIEEDLAAKEVAIEEQAASQEFDPEKIISMKDDYDMMDMKKDRYVELKKELF